jgi:hypothetical protein
LKRGGTKLKGLIKGKKYRQMGAGGVKIGRLQERENIIF